jgi:rhodanese-related sulfurtransferase
MKGEFRESFLTEERYPGIRLITLMETEDLFIGERALILDARPAALYRDGHVPRALSLPYAEAKGKVPSEVLAFDRSGTVIIYCEGGDCQSSLGVAKILHDLGFEDLRIFSGGWAEWIQAGLPEVRENG